LEGLDGGSIVQRDEPVASEGTHPTSYGYFNLGLLVLQQFNYCFVLHDHFLRGANILQKITKKENTKMQKVEF